jgi:hypothetical protein
MRDMELVNIITHKDGRPSAVEVRRKEIRFVRSGLLRDERKEGQLLGFIVPVLGFTYARARLDLETVCQPSE